MRNDLITCHELIDFLDDYVEGELSEEGRAKFERHLAVCPSCVAFLESYRETVAALHRIAPDELCDDAPEELVTAILDARS